jgi:nitrite reductase/ring-hydroxylating ferredoxin subunit
MAPGSDIKGRSHVAAVGDLREGNVMRVEVDGHALCLARVKDGGFFAIDDRCTHEDIELSDGDLDGFEVECPMHGSRFDVRDGSVCGLPATIPTTTYAVDVEGDDVYVQL